MYQCLSRYFYEQGNLFDAANRSVDGFSATRPTTEVAGTFNDLVNPVLGLRARYGPRFRVTTGVNDKLDYEYLGDGIPRTITIAGGIYTAAALAEAIEDGISQVTVTCTFDEGNYFTIVSTADDIELSFGTGANAATTIAPVIGYDSTDHAYAETHVSDFTPPCIIPFFRVGSTPTPTKPRYVVFHKPTYSTSGGETTRPTVVPSELTLHVWGHTSDLGSDPATWESTALFDYSTTVEFDPETVGTRKSRYMAVVDIGIPGTKYKYWAVGFETASPGMLWLELGYLALMVPEDPFAGESINISPAQSFSYKIPGGVSHGYGGARYSNTASMQKVWRCKMDGIQGGGDTNLSRLVDEYAKSSGRSNLYLPDLSRFDPTIANDQMHEDSYIWGVWQLDGGLEVGIRRYTGDDFGDVQFSFDESVE